MVDRVVPFFRYCDTVGDGSGTIQAIGDYSAALTNFQLVPGGTDYYEIYRILLHIEDSSPMSGDEYGNLNVALTNGIEIQVRNATEVVNDCTDGIPIKTNADWGRVCYDVSAQTFGAGNDMIQARWTFARSGMPLRIRASHDEFFTVRLNDNFTGLVSHTFMVQGTKWVGGKR